LAEPLNPTVNGAACYETKFAGSSTRTEMLICHTQVELPGRVRRTTLTLEPRILPADNIRVRLRRVARHCTLVDVVSSDSRPETCLEFRGRPRLRQSAVPIRSR